MQLRPWQQDALERGKDRPRCYIEARPRLGKTRYTCAWFEQIGARRRLVTSPLSVTYDWEKELKLHSEVPVYNLTDVKPLKRLLKALEALKTVETGFTIILNTDAVRALEKVKRKYEPTKVLEALLELKIEAWALDEAHQAKGVNSSRGKCMRHLAKHIPNIRLLSGSPLPNGPEDAWGQYTMIDPERWGESYFSHKRKHFITNSWEFDRVVGLRYPEVFQRMIDENTLRYEREDVFGPDEWVETVRSIPMSSELHKIYHDAYKNWVLEANGERLGLEHTLSRILRLRELCAGYMPVLDDEHKVTDKVEIHRDKLQAVLDDTESAVSAGESVVIFCQFSWEVVAYSEALKCSVIEGGQTASERHQLIERFNATPGQVIVVQTQAGGIGISLASATHAFFTSQGFAWEIEKQARDRIFTPGKPRCVTYYRMMNSVDEYIASILESKQVFIDAMKNSDIKQIAFGLEYGRPRFGKVRDA